MILSLANFITFSRQTLIAALATRSMPLVEQTDLDCGVIDLPAMPEME